MHRIEKGGVMSQFTNEPPLGKLRNFISGLKLFPKTHDFFGYFERSSLNTVQGAKVLCEMIAKKEERHELVKVLKDLEHVGDKITHEVVDLLRNTFLTPFDRSDIHLLVVKMDDILDIIYYIGNRLTRYNVNEFPEEMAELANIVLRSCEELTKAVAGLNNMKNMEAILQNCIVVNTLENEADEVMNTVVERLFSEKWDACQIIKVKELCENLEAAVDKCEDVAEIIQSIILKNS